MTFKVGDRVKRLSSGWQLQLLHVGGIYTVLWANDSSIGLEGQSGSFNSDLFELVPTPQDIKPGTKVRVTFEGTMQESGPGQGFTVSWPNAIGKPGWPMAEIPSDATFEVLKEPERTQKEFEAILWQHLHARLLVTTDELLSMLGLTDLTESERWTFTAAVHRVRDETARSVWDAGTE